MLFARFGRRVVEIDNREREVDILESLIIWLTRERRRYWGRHLRLVVASANSSPVPVQRSSGHGIVFHRQGGGRGPMICLLAPPTPRPGPPLF